MNLDEKNTLRKLITSHPQWDHVRKTEGFSSDNLSVQDLRYLATRFGITLPTGETPLSNRPTTTPTLPPAPVTPSPDGMGPQTVTPAPVAPRKPQDIPLDKRRQTLEQLLDVLLSGGGPIDEASVVALIDTHLASLNLINIHHVNDAPLPIAPNSVTGHPALKTLLKLLSVRDRSGYRPNVFISGPTGSGKTFAAKQVAEAFGLTYHHQGAMCMPHEATGHTDIRGRYVWVALTLALKHGGVCLLDEADSSDNAPLLAVKASMSGNEITLPGGEKVTRHKDCIILIAANTWGNGPTADYVGRNKLDAAILSDFPVRLYWGYDEAFERTLCKDEAWCRHFHKARATVARTGLKVTMCPRVLMAGDAYVSNGVLTIQEAAEFTYQAALTPEQRNLFN
jgi:cobaltochelatase CobS